MDEGSYSQQQQHNSNNNTSQGYHHTTRGKKTNRGKANNKRDGRGGHGSSGGTGAGGGGAPHHQPQYQQYQAYPSYQHPFLNPWAGWAQPPYPYPATLCQLRLPRQAGVVGPGPPQQAYNTSVAPPHVRYTPTDINAAMHTLALCQPDQNWYMDTGATSHMTVDQGLADGEPSNEV